MTQEVFHRGFAPMKALLPAAVARPVRALATAVLAPFRFSLRTGHLRSSLANKAVDAKGRPLPWYTYPAIEFLSQRSFADKHVLEFGGGQSSLWWGVHAQSVLTIEEDKDWAEYVKGKVAANVTVRHIPADAATRSIEPVRAAIEAEPVTRFDVIVIDGHLRFELVPLAFELLAKDGVIILDNAEGYGFYDQIKDRQCRRVDFFGFSPGGSLRSCTTLIWMGDCFLLKPDLPLPYIEAVG